MPTPRLSSTALAAHLHAESPATRRTALALRKAVPAAALRAAEGVGEIAADWRRKKKASHR